MKPTAAELLADRPRLRALLATEVMGWLRKGLPTPTDYGPSVRAYWWDGDKRVLTEVGTVGSNHDTRKWMRGSVPYEPDLRIDQAFEVVEKLQPGNFWFELRSNQTGTAAYFLSDDEMYSASAETPALAICLAALRAAGATE